MLSRAFLRMQMCFKKSAFGWRFEGIIRQSANHVAENGN